ncbi:hypothetical protein [Methyloraptor flagellatus]|uniref:Flagellar hook-associated protein 1 n=1 Tax=Methyloraptor flagellatus TaxID=3162530 RepID=A0AAU7X477_9HYPH
MSSVSFQNLFRNLGQGYTSLDPSQIDANGNPVNNNLTGLGLTAADLTKLGKSPTSYLAGVNGPDPTNSAAAANAIYQPLDGLSVGGTYQGDGRASVMAQKLAGASAPVYPDGFIDPNTGAPYRAAQVDPAKFQSWTTGYQKEFIYDELFAAGLLSPGFKATGIPTAADLARLKSGIALPVPIGGNSSNAVHVVISPSLDANGKQIPENQVKVIVVENLTKTKFATMTLAEQTLVAGTDYFQNVLSTQLAMKVNGAILTTAATAVKSAILDPANKRSITAVTQAIIGDAAALGVYIDSDPNSANFGKFNGVSGQETENKNMDGRLLNYNDVKIFLDEINALKAQVANMAILSDDSIETKVADIFNRYKQVSAFGSIPNQVSAADVSFGYKEPNGNINNTSKITKNVVSMDVGTATTPVNVTQTTTTVYYHTLQAHDAKDKNRIPADSFITPDDWDNYWKGNASWFTTTDDGKRFYVKDGNGQQVWLKAGVVVQTDGEGRIIGPVYTSGGVAIDGNYPGYHYAGGPGSDGQTVLDGNNDQPPVSKTTVTKVPLVGLQTGRYPMDNANYIPSWGEPANNNLGYVWAGDPSHPPIMKVDLPTIKTNKTGLDGTNQSSIASGYNKLISAERTSLSLQNQMDQVAKSQSISTGTAGVDKSLDLPSLIFFMQFYTNLIKEQQVNAATEMVNQQNQLLNAYSQMQNLVNAAQSNFDAKEQTEERDLFGNKVTGNDNTTDTYIGDVVDKTTQAPLSQATLNILSMFDSVGALAKTADPTDGNKTMRNPIEKLFNITRPVKQLIDLGTNGTGGTTHTCGYTSTAWNSFGTELSSAVTQINQQTQIMMNNINTLDKEKNQHFDLANNCLTKLNELMASIGRNVA